MQKNYETLKNQRMRQDAFAGCVCEIDQHTLPTHPIEGLTRDFTSPPQELLELELLLPTLLPSRPLLELQRYKASTSQSTSHTGD